MYYRPKKRTVQTIPKIFFRSSFFRETQYANLGYSGVSLDVNEYVSSLKASERLGDQVVFSKVLPARVARKTDPKIRFSADVKKIMEERKINLPIVMAVYNILYENISPYIEINLLTDKLK